jgi:cell division protein FtsB
LHGLVERRPLDALELLVEKVDELSKRAAELERRIAALEDNETPAA